jgi:hypothetical protein
LAVIRGDSFLGSFEEDDDVDGIQVDEDELSAAGHGGVPAIIELYIRMRSLTAKRRLFYLILRSGRLSRASTGACFECSQFEGKHALFLASSDWPYGFLRANDGGDVMVKVFRVGPERTFVMDSPRHFLFQANGCKIRYTLILKSATSSNSV